MLDLDKEIGLPAPAEIKNTFGSMLVVDLSGSRGRAELLLDNCRWVVVIDGKMTSYDLDISSSDPISGMIPDPNLRAAELFADRYVLTFGDRDMIIFMTHAYHRFLEKGVEKASSEWNSLPQDQKDNFTLLFPDDREPVGVEFRSFLDPANYSWGPDFLRREGELGRA